MRSRALLNALTRLEQAKTAPNSPALPNSFGADASTKSLAVAALAAAEIRVVGYGRRSNKKDGSDSYDRQERDLRAYSLARFQCSLSAFIFDKSKSGRTTNRPGYRQLEADILNRKFDVVVVEHVDRIGRSAAIVTAFKQLCDSVGVKIHSLNKGGEIAGFDAAVGGYLSEEQVAVMRDRVMAGQVKAAASKPTNMPFGFVKVGGVWAVDESKRKMVEYMFSAAKAGMATDTIARILNARFAMEGKLDAPHFCQSTVARWLTNPKFMGLSFYGTTTRRMNTFTGETEYAEVPEEEWIVTDASKLKIIDKGTFFAVSDRFGGPRPRKLARPHSLIPSTLPVCANCGSSMKTAKKTRVARAYDLRCVERECREHKGHLLSQVEDEMLKAVRAVLADPNYESVFIEQLQSEQGRIAAELSERRKRLESRKSKMAAHIQVLLQQAVKKRLKEQANREAALAGINTGEEEDDDDLFKDFTVEQIKEQVASASAELKAVELELARLPPAPKMLEPGRRSFLMEAFDRVAKAKLDSPNCSALEEGQLLDAQTAIASIVEVIRIGTVYPGRASRYEVVVRLDSIFGDAVSDICDPRSTFVSVVHPDVVAKQQQHYDIDEAIDAYNKRLYAATDEQFAAVEMAISTILKTKLANHSLTLRNYVDIVFLIARAGIGTQFLRKLVPGKKITIQKIITDSIRDGSWDRVFSIVGDRFPDLFKLMNAAGFRDRILANDEYSRTWRRARRENGPSRAGVNCKREKSAATSAQADPGRARRGAAPRRA